MVKVIRRAKFWQNEKECCGTCSHVEPEDALIRPGYQATCLVFENQIKNCRKQVCEQYSRRNE